MVDETVLPGEGADAIGVIGSFHLHQYAGQPGNKKFVADYKAKFQKDANAFAVQMWDAGDLIKAALEKTGGDVTPSTLDARRVRTEMEQPPRAR